MKKYLVLDSNPSKDYTLLVSLDENGEVNTRTPQPFIVAWLYDEKSVSWSQGHYFYNLQGAVNYLYEE